MIGRLTMLLWASSLLAACDKSSQPGPAGEKQPAVEMPPAAEVAPLVASSNQLGFALWGHVRQTSGNLALSPASISAALSMTWAGARGKTTDELRAVLRLDGTPDEMMARWGRLSGALQNPARPLELRIANRLFGERTFRFEPQFLDRTRAAFGAPLEALDFRTDQTAADASRGRINDWVDGVTKHRIRDLLPKGSVTQDTRIVLVNAIYFLAKWARRFEEAATSPQPFRIAGATEKPVPMMRQLGSFRIAKADGLALLELPYKGDAVAMYVALPDEVDGLAAMEQGFDAAKLAALTGALRPQEVDVWLPRFQIDPAAPLDLKSPLQELGMKQAFDPAQADLSGIGAPPPPDRLFVTGVFHKAFVKTDESGTEAAAATAVVVAVEPSAPPPPVVFKADHPFLFFIVDRPTGLVLFMGRVADPS